MNRRSFLRTALMGLGAVAAAPLLARLPQDDDDGFKRALDKPTNRLTGGFGSHLAQSFERHRIRQHRERAWRVTHPDTRGRDAISDTDIYYATT